MDKVFKNLFHELLMKQNLGSVQKNINNAILNLLLKERRLSFIIQRNLTRVMQHDNKQQLNSNSSSNSKIPIAFHASNDVDIRNRILNSNEYTVHAEDSIGNVINSHNLGIQESSTNFGNYSSLVTNKIITTIGYKENQKDATLDNVDLNVKKQRESLSFLPFHKNGASKQEQSDINVGSNPITEVVSMNQRDNACGDTIIGNIFKTPLDSKYENIREKRKDFSEKLKHSYMRIKYTKESTRTYWKCNYCLYTANILSSMKSHIKGPHKRIQDFKCEDCCCIASDKMSLNQHVTTVHLKIKDVKCKDCSYVTSHKGYLKQHCKANHKITKDLQCQDCSYVTSDKRKLKQHFKAVHKKINTTKDIECKECSYKTTVQSNLRRHVEEFHNKIKYLECEDCSYTTCNSVHLKIHIKKTHVQAKYIDCTQCKYATTEKSTLMRHIKAKHTEKE